MPVPSRWLRRAEELGESMLRRPHYLALGVVILLTLGLLKLPSPAAANLKLAISGMFLPLFGLAGSTAALVDRASYALLPRRELVRQIEFLEKTNQLWQIHFRQAQEWKRENDRLRDQFGVPRQYPGKLRLGRVVARDPANW